jgi:hypothetical protein
VSVTPVRISSPFGDRLRFRRARQGGPLHDRPTFAEAAFERAVGAQPDEHPVAVVAGRDDPPVGEEGGVAQPRVAARADFGDLGDGHHPAVAEAPRRRAGRGEEHQRRHLFPVGRRDRSAHQQTAFRGGAHLAPGDLGIAEDAALGEREVGLPARFVAADFAARPPFR